MREAKGKPMTDKTQKTYSGIDVDQEMLQQPRQDNPHNSWVFGGPDVYDRYEQRVQRAQYTAKNRKHLSSEIG